MNLQKLLVLSSFVLFLALLEPIQSQSPEKLQQMDAEVIKNFLAHQGELKKAMSNVGSLLVVNSQNFENLVQNSKLFILIFYNPLEFTWKGMNEYAATIIREKSDATIGFANVLEETQLAKEHSVRYTPMVKMWNKGIPNLQISPEITLTPRTVPNALKLINEASYQNIPEPNHRNYLKETENDPFYIVCLCEKNSQEFDIIKDFASVRNGLHNVFLLNPKKQGFRESLNATDSPLNQIILVNKYLELKQAAPNSVKTAWDFYQFLMGNKWNQTVMNLASQNAHELQNQIKPFMVYIPSLSKDLKSLENIAKTLQQVAIDKNFSLEQIFIVNPKDSWVNFIEVIKKTDRNQDQVAIVENGNYPAYSNVFIMTERAKNTQNILSFYNAYENDKLPVQYLSAPASTEKTQNGIVYFTRNTFRKYINAKADLLVFYYKDPNALKSKLAALESVRDRIKKNQKIEIGVLDISLNDVSDLVRIGRQAALVLHPEKSFKDMRVLSWEQITSEEAILAFLKAFTTQKWEQPGPKKKEAL